MKFYCKFVSIKYVYTFIYVQEYNTVCPLFRGYVKNELGLEKMRDRIREEVPSDKDSLENLTFAELAIRKHLIDPQDLPWDKCYIMIGSFVANVVPLIYLTMLCLTNISFEKEYQEKMHREIQKAKSRSKDDIISLKEAKQFIYIKAALMEVVRIMSPPYIPRIVTQDIMVKGKTLLIAEKLEENL